MPEVVAFLDDVIRDNYMPYAIEVITNRALPAIDGLKPVHRHVLYTMYKMGLLGGTRTKCANIVGQAMKLHPHGDGPIYEAMTRMAKDNESLNNPYIDSKGNFGKHYSRDMAYAAYRYTEAALMPICKELFDGIDENAVDMVDNYDGQEKEPALLPVKFPSILVNTSTGIAVGMSSGIPSFNIKNICDATIGIIQNKISNAGELMDTLGVPEFTSGGFIHADENALKQLGTHGKASLHCSGVVQIYTDHIDVIQIPYNTTAEKIVEDIIEAVKLGHLKGISDVRDDTDLKGFKITIELKKNVNVQKLLKKLCRYTDIRTKIAFNTRAIFKNDDGSLKCDNIGLLDLLRAWVDFRVKTVQRVYKHRYEKSLLKLELLEAWEKVQGRLVELIEIITKMEEADAAALLATNFSLTDRQVEHLMDIRIRQLTTDYVAKKIRELSDLRIEIDRIVGIIASDSEKHQIIIDELSEISKKYGHEKRTKMADLVKEETDSDEENTGEDTAYAVVALTKKGYVKRVDGMQKALSLPLEADDEVIKTWMTANDHQILVFTKDGEVRKVPVIAIDASKGAVKDQLFELAKLENASGILFVDDCGDYSKHINVVFDNGRGRKIPYELVKGKRQKYVHLFDNDEGGTVKVIDVDKFFIITAKRKASYCDITNAGMFSGRAAFKAARIDSGDYIWGLQPVEKVPDMSAISLERYQKPYCVKIGEDILW